jgi:hypothetical protein
MNRVLKWAAFLRPSVQRDVIALVIGCTMHPAYRVRRRPPRKWRAGSGELASGWTPACRTCEFLYAAKQRVKRLLR